jgi:uncharacterized protein YndB with AHSA1/START domain
MLTTDESVTINKPRSEVFTWFTDPANVTVYSSNIVDYDITSGQSNEIGRTGRAVAKVAGIKLESEDTLVEYVEGERYKLVADKARVPYTLTITFSDEDGGTKVRWLQESESFKGVFKLADKLVLKLYSRDVRNNLEKAKAILEE